MLYVLLKLFVECLKICFGAFRLVLGRQQPFMCTVLKSQWDDVTLHHAPVMYVLVVGYYAVLLLLHVHVWSTMHY